MFANGTTSTSKPALNNNAWPKLPNSNTGNFNTNQNQWWINVNGSSTPWPQLGGRRDYVNTNIPAPTWVRPTTKSSQGKLNFNPNPGPPSNPRQNAHNSYSRRDFVNPNIPTAPSGGSRGQSSQNRGNFYNPNSNRQTNSNNPPKSSSIGPTTNKMYENVNEAEDNELREFSETLLSKDVNNAAKYVTINYQSKTTSRSQVDEAPQP